MKTIKRLAIFSAVGLLVCIIAVAVLIPIATSDTVALAKEWDATYSQLEEKATFSATGVNRVSLSGNYVSNLRLRPSADDQIHVFIDGYHIEESTFTSSPSADGQLTIHHIGGTYYFYNAFNQEAILRSIAAGFSNRGNRDVEIHLPAGVSYVHTEGQFSYGGLDAQGVNIISIEPTPPQAPADGNIPREVKAQVRECNQKLLTLYEGYYQGRITREEAATSMNLLREDYIVQVEAYLGQGSRAELLWWSGQMQEQTFMQLDIDRLGRSYRVGEIEREAYQQQRAYLEQELETLKDAQLQLDDRMEQELEELEARLDDNLLFLESLDATLLLTYQ